MNIKIDFFLLFLQYLFHLFSHNLIKEITQLDKMEQLFYRTLLLLSLNAI
jgi:hypothetical protein